MFCAAVQTDAELCGAGMFEWTQKEIRQQQQGDAFSEQQSAK